MESLGFTELRGQLKQGRQKITDRDVLKNNEYTPDSTCSVVKLRSGLGFIVSFPGPVAPVPRGSHRENVGSSEIRGRDCARALRTSDPQP